MRRRCLAGGRGPGPFAVVVLVATAGGVFAQPAALFRPAADFYGARGRGVTVEWAVDRDRVAVGEPLVATLTVRGASNPHEITRPDLRTLDAFAARFQIEDVPGPPAVAGATEVAFAYRLRPRTADVRELPRLAFVFLNPAYPPGQQARTARPAPVRLTVVPPAAPPPAPPEPLDAPAFLFDLPGGLDGGSGGAFVPCPVAVAAVALAGPALSLAWYVGWRRVYPDARRVAHARRTRAARRALAALAAAGRAPDPALAAHAAVFGYLRERFALPPGAATPGDVSAALRAHGVPGERADAVADFGRGCDAARFAPAGDDGVSLADAGRRVVVDLEAV